MQLVIDILLDILLIAVFAILVFQGWRRGFFKSVLRVGRLILSVVLTVIFGSSVAAWMDETFINPPVYKVVFDKLSSIADDVAATANGSVDAMVEKIPEGFRDHLDLSSVDPTAGLNALVEEWSNTVAGSISLVIATVLGYVLLFVACFLVLTVVIAIVGKLAKLPLLKTADKILGLVMGVVSGAIAVIAISVILGALLGVFGQGELVENSFMLRLFSGLSEKLLS